MLYKGPRLLIGHTVAQSTASPASRRAQGLRDPQCPCCFRVGSGGAGPRSPGSHPTRAGGGCEDTKLANPVLFWVTPSQEVPGTSHGGTTCPCLALMAPGGARSCGTGCSHGMAPCPPRIGAERAVGAPGQKEGGCWWSTGQLGRVTAVAWGLP